MKIRKPFNRYTWISTFIDNNYIKLDNTSLFTQNQIIKLSKYFKIFKPISHLFKLKSRSAGRLGRGTSKIIGKRFYVLKNQIIIKQ